MAHQDTGEFPLTLARVETLIDRAVKQHENRFAEMIAARDKALALQAAEYERRLNLLNGEHTTLTEMRDQYVPKIQYDADMARLYSERKAAIADAEENRRRLEAAAALNRRNTMLGAAATATAVVGWGISLALRFLPGGSER